MNTNELVQRIKEEQGYLQVKELEDGSIAAILDLMYTRAIILGVDAYGYSSRFCFKDRALADRRFLELTSEDDVPEGFIARR
jgi:hypothetical protein